MSDLLTSASLLLTVITVMYSLWIQHIDKAFSIKKKQHADDRIDDYKEVKKIIKTKAIPLAVSAWVLCLIFLPESIKISIHSYNFLKANGWGSIKYNSVVVTFIIINIVLFLMSLLTTQILLSLNKKAAELNPYQ